MRADAAAKRQDILRAAWSLFSALGAEVSLRSIAQEAGVGIATLYRHFPTREDLIVGITEEIRTRVTAIEAAHAHEWDDDPRAAWHGVVRDLAALRLGVLASHIAPAAKDIPGFLERAEPHRTALIGVIAGMLRRAQAAGLVDEAVEPWQFQIGLSSLSRPIPVPPWLVVNDLQDWLVGVYLAGLEPRAPRVPQHD